MVAHDITSWRGAIRPLRQILPYAGQRHQVHGGGERPRRTGVGSGDDVMIRFEVTDTGIGISPKVRPGVSIVFSGRRSTTRRSPARSGPRDLEEPGKGHGGTIGWTAAGKGSTFWFTGG